VPLVVLKAVEEDQLHILQEAVQSSVDPTLDLTANGSQVHGFTYDVTVVGTLVCVGVYVNM